MNTKLVVIGFLFITVVPVTLLARAEYNDGNVPPAAFAISSSAAEKQALTDVLNIPSPVPRGPKDVLQDHAAEMTAITQKFSASVAAIAEAVNSGELSSEQGQKLISEQYQIAQMQFELLAASRDLLEKDLARNVNAQSDPASPQVRGPRSVDQELAHLTKDLELTADQRKQIRPLLQEHQDKIQALRDNNPTLSREDLAPQIRAISDQTHQEIEALLTKHQRQLAKTMQKRMHDGEESRRPVGSGVS